MKVAEIEQAQVTWALSLEATATASAIGPVRAQGGSGLATGRRMAPFQGDYVPAQSVSFTFSSLTLSALDSEHGEALRAWAAEVTTFAEACAQQEPATCAKNWEVAALGRTGWLEAKDENGAALARWRLIGAYPIALVGGRALADLLTLELSVDEASFAFHDAPFTVAALGATLPPEAKIPAYPPIDTPEDAAAFHLSAERFRASYLSPTELLEQLNAHGALSARASTDSARAELVQRAQNFQIEIDGVIQGGFKEISGLEAEIEVIEYRNGDDPLTRKRPGRTRYANIHLEHGSTTGTATRDWYKKVLAGTTDRKSGSIIYLDREGNEALRYNFFEAWPCRWKAPELDATSDSHAVEELEFVVERVERG